MEGGHTKRYILLPSTVVDAPYGLGSESALAGYLFGMEDDG